MPSCAVTTVVIVVVAPSAKAIEPDSAPEATAVPSTVIVALASAAVGITVTDEIALPTDVVYVVVLPVVPVLVNTEEGFSFKVIKKGTLDGALVTAIE